MCGSRVERDRSADFRNGLPQVPRQDAPHPERGNPVRQAEALLLCPSGWIGRWSDAGDVGGEEVDAVAVEVAAGSVVVLGGPRVGVTGEDLCVAEWYSGVEGVGDGGVSQGVGAYVSWDAAVLAIRSTIR
jgi:hypothetical protein